MKQATLLSIAIALSLGIPREASTEPRGNVYLLHTLVSDLPAHAERLDPNLVNPWGIAYGPGGPFWISGNGTGVSTLYDGEGRSFPAGNPLVVTIPAPAGGNPPAAPTGIVFSGMTAFEAAPSKPAAFIFATEDGTISAWNHAADATHALLKVDQSTSKAVYKGLALGHNTAGDFLFATNFRAGKIDVFNSAFAPASLAGSFTDPNLPSGFAPFGIRNINGNLYVTYAMQDPAKHDDVAGPGNGFVDVFDTEGRLMKRLISRGVLNSPWGLAVAPSNFGDLSGSLLVGNFGDGAIHGFDAANGSLAGQMLDPSGRALSIPGLWGLLFGNGGLGGDVGVLYFTAGIPGPDNVEDHGAFGEIRPQHP